MWLEVWQAAYDHLFNYIAAYMFLALAVMLFTGMPVALALGGVATLFAFAAIQLDFLDWPIFFPDRSAILGRGQRFGRGSKPGSCRGALFHLHGDDA